MEEKAEASSWGGADPEFSRKFRLFKKYAIDHVKVDFPSFKEHAGHFKGDFGIALKRSEDLKDLLERTELVYIEAEDWCFGELERRAQESVKAQAEKFEHDV